MMSNESHDEQFDKAPLPTTQVDADVAQMWSKEIKRRVDELDNGQVKPIPWSVAREYIINSFSDTSDDGAVRQSR